MNERRLGEWGATGAGDPAPALGRLSEERALNEPERPQGQWASNGPERARRDPTERDRTLARVRTTTAVTGIGAVLVGGALAGWLGHEASQSATTDPSSSSTSESGSASSSDDGLSGPDSLPDAGSGSDSGQPGITSGGS